MCGSASDCLSMGSVSNLPDAFSKLGGNFVPPLCLCLSEEILKAVGPFYLVSMSGE